MKLIFTSILALALLLFFYACEENGAEKDSEETISGYVQKGPFLNGTSITVSELSKDLVPTGRAFSSQIQDNSGTFQVQGVKISESRYVELKASGFYFNEVNNVNSNAQLTLYALSDLTDRSSLNVNLLSNLEKRRVQYLLSNGFTFAEAKHKAQAEILSIFNISLTDISSSEDLDITQSGEGNGALLAASLILQGYLSVSDLSELVADISSDIFDDGTLDNTSLGATLATNASLLDVSQIRSNLEDRYEELGLTVSIPDFESHIETFIAQNDYGTESGISYPGYGLYGKNILSMQDSSTSGGNFSMAAVLAEGTSVKVRGIGSNWSYVGSSNNGWTITSSNDTTDLESNQVGDIDLNIVINADSSFHQSVLFELSENNEPVHRSIQITVVP